MAKAIAKIEGEIDKVSSRIDALDADMKVAKEKGNENEVKELRKKEEHLWKKEEQLRKEKEQLREEKLLLLQRQPGALSRECRAFMLGCAVMHVCQRHG